MSSLHMYVMWLLTKHILVLSKVVKQDTLLQSFSLLDANSARCETFEVLAIQVENLLIQLKTIDTKLRAKKPPNLEKKTSGKNP